MKSSKGKRSSNNYKLNIFMVLLLVTHVTMHQYSKDNSQKVKTRVIQEQETKATVDDGSQMAVPLYNGETSKLETEAYYKSTKMANEIEFVYHSFINDP